MAMDPTQLQNLRDFLYLFNRLSQSCFSRCAHDFGRVTLNPEELNCVDRCIDKSVHVNQRLMKVYIEANPEFQERKQRELQEQAEAAAARAAAEAERLAKNPNSNWLGSIKAKLSSFGKKGQGQGQGQSHLTPPNESTSTETESASATKKGEAGSVGL